jgi:uncharacterized protein (TIRG00374 family)
VIPATTTLARRERPWLRPLLAGAGYAAIVLLAWRAIDRTAFLEGIARLTARSLATIAVVAVLHIAGRALRFHRLLLRCHPTDYRWTDGMRIFLVGLSASSVTPARAGDFIKARLVKPHGIGFSMGLGLVMVERMLDLLVIVASIVLTGAFLSEGASGPWKSAAVVLLAGLVAAVVVVNVRPLRARLLGVAAHLLAKAKRSPEARVALEGTLAGAFHVWDEVFVSPYVFAGYWAYSAAVWAVEFLKLWLVLQYVGAHVSPEVVLFVYPVSIVAGILTLLPFSEGVVGVTGVTLLTSLGHVDSGTATIAVVIDRVASNVPPLLLWALFAMLGRSAAREREI